MTQPNSSKHIAIQADDLNLLNTSRDSTLMIAREGISRGHQVFHYTPQSLFFKDETLYAETTCLNDGTVHASLSLFDMKMIFIRQNPPFDMAYITSTYLLDLAHQRGVRIINSPSGVRNFTEKLGILHFKPWCIPTLISQDTQHFLEFLRKHQHIVMKPLYGYGGEGIQAFQSSDEDALKNYIKNATLPLMAQKFLEEIHQGEKRITVIQGHIVGSLLKKPMGNEFRSNSRFQSELTPCTLTKKETKITQNVMNYLSNMGITFFGMDMIAGHISEINVTSPGLLYDINQYHGGKCEDFFFEQ